MDGIVFYRSDLPKVVWDMFVNISNKTSEFFDNSINDSICSNVMTIGSFIKLMKSLSLEASIEAISIN